MQKSSHRFIANIFLLTKLLYAKIVVLVSISNKMADTDD